MRIEKTCLRAAPLATHTHTHTHTRQTHKYVDIFADVSVDVCPKEDMCMHACIWADGYRDTQILQGSLYVMFDYAVIFANRLHENHMGS